VSSAVEQRLGKAAYLQGVSNNVLNPKPALFYLAFLPQFIRPGDNVLVLTTIMVGIHVAIGIVWLLSWGHLVCRARGALGAPRWRARLDRITGSVLIAFGLRLATALR
jgi:threonine/homoserine/homoserine lactone efflux protein